MVDDKRPQRDRLSKSDSAILTYAGSQCQSVSDLRIRPGVETLLPDDDPGLATGRKDQPQHGTGAYSPGFLAMDRIWGADCRPVSQLSSAGDACKPPDYFLNRSAQAMS